MPITIRSRLLLLVLSVLLPGLVGAAWLIANTLAAERSAQERSLRETARALAMVVDRELVQRAAVARTLAQSRWLDDAPELTPLQLAGFETVARRSMEGMAGWVELHSAEAVLLSTRPAGAALAPAAIGAATAAAPLSPSPLVLPLQNAASGEEAHAAVVQPVERQGRLVLNLRITIRPLELQRIIDQQKLPPDWVGTVVDHRGTVIARHPGGKSHIGRIATADLRKAMAQAPEGLFESTSLDGRRTTGYYSMSPQGWAYVSAMPREQFAGLAQRGVVQVALGAFLLLAVAVAGALGVARRIVQPVQTLKAAAARMQAGQPVLVGAAGGTAGTTETGIAEYDEVARALADAGSAIASARAELEQQVAAAIARTRQAEQRLSQGQRVEALGRLTGGVAHDFNNLLGVISNSAHLIGRHPAAAELAMPLAATLRAVQTGSQLTQHLLRFAGHRPVRPGTLELGRHLPELLELLRSVLGRRIELSLKVAPDTAPVHVDADEFELALVNLAMNARDAMPRGGGLHLAARNATEADRQDFADLDGSTALGGVAPGPLVLLTVRDDGVGMDADVASRVFEPFFTTKPFGQGSGLGLSQVHGFVTQAGGAVRVASTPGVGTTVLVLLPVAAAAQPGPPAPAAAGDALSLAGARVLLVDDNRALAALTQVLLEEQGVQVSLAHDASQAMRLVAEEPEFDAVLTDVMMPGDTDGLALARWLLVHHPVLAVVLISAYSNAASQSGFPFLRKPCPPEALLAALGSAVATTAQRRQAAAAPGL